MKTLTKSILILVLSTSTSLIFAQKEVNDTIPAGCMVSNIQSSITTSYCEPKIYQEGVEVFKELVKINPNDKDWNFYLGMCYYNLDKFEEAEKYLLIASEDIIYKIKIVYLKELHDTRSVKL
jgi:tetratricopeptide (TPR) repeat protein